MVVVNALLLVEGWGKLVLVSLLALSLVRTILDRCRMFDKGTEGGDMTRTRKRGKREGNVRKRIIKDQNIAGDTGHSYSSSSSLTPLTLANKARPWKIILPFHPPFLSKTWPIIMSLIFLLRACFKDTLDCIPRTF